MHPIYVSKSIVEVYVIRFRVILDPVRYGLHLSIIPPVMLKQSAAKLKISEAASAEYDRIQTAVDMLHRKQGSVKCNNLSHMAEQAGYRCIIIFHPLVVTNLRLSYWPRSEEYNPYICSLFFYIISIPIGSILQPT